MFDQTNSPAYRRGLVLGLTLAEIFLLLLFLLLLVSAYFVDEERNRFEKASQAYQDLFPDTLSPSDRALRLAQLQGAKETLDHLGLPIDDPTELRTRLVSLTEKEALLAEYRLVCGKLDEIQKLLSRELFNADDSAADAMASCASALEAREDPNAPMTLPAANMTIARLRRQIDALSTTVDELSSGSLGADYPSCWFTNEINGRTFYLYNVTIRDNGMVVVPGDPREGQDIQPALRANGPEPQFNQLLSRGQFNDSTRGMFEWSVREKCHIFVRLIDGTSETNKNGYKTMRRTVEGRFYIYDVK